MKNQSTSLEIVATIVTGYGMWQHPVAVEKALCSDGIRRKVRLNQDGQTGRCTIGKKTLRGFFCAVSELCGAVEDYKFVAYSDQSK